MTVRPQLIRELRLADPLLHGEDVEGIRRKLHLFNRVPLGAMPKKTAARRTYGQGMVALCRTAQDDMVIATTGRVDNRMLGLLNKDPNVAADEFADYLLQKYAAQHPPRKVPDLGPVYRGGRSILSQDLTHETDGIPGYPAFDDGWVAGRAVIAPERLEVSGQSSAQEGDAFYAQGESSILYWFGHVVAAPATGRSFRKGETVATIARTSTPHVHTGINAAPLIGHQLAHHTDYTHGAPTVGEQLGAWARRA